MVQVHACVSVRCDQCRGSAGFEAHYATEDAALGAAAAAGWLVGPGGRLWCSACGPVLICEVEGHQFSPWRHPVISDERPVLSEYRRCRRCCLEDSRQARWLIGSPPELGKSTAAGALLAAGTDVVEVAP